MLRFIIGLYLTGVVAVLVLLLLLKPEVALGDAVVGALLWPWAVYKYFIAAGGGA